MAAPAPKAGLASLHPNLPTPTSIASFFKPAPGVVPAESMKQAESMNTAEVLLPPPFISIAAGKSQVFPFPQAVPAKSGTELIEDLQTKNKKLEAENVKLKSENAILKRKLTTANVPASGAGQAAATGPPAKKQKPLDTSKFFAKWGKALVKAVPRAKFDNTCWGDAFQKVVVNEAGLLQEVFLALFDGKGELIQPTKENKPTSVVTIRRFSDFEAIQGLFGEQNIQRDGYKTTMWRKHMFQKAYKSGESPATVESLEVHYNRNKLSLELHFGIEVAEDCDW